MAFIRVLMVESLCQTATGRISALECLVPGPRGSQWLRPILFGIGGSWVRLTGSRMRVELGHEDGLNRFNRWRGTARPWILRWHKMVGTNHSRV
jgi:hypothetical protein